MKTQLLVSLLCITLGVSAAAAVPVEDADSADGPASPDVVPEGRADVSDSVVAAADVDVDQPATSDDAAAVVMEEPLRSKTPRNGLSSLVVPERPLSHCPQGWHQHQENCHIVVNLTYSRINAEFLCESIGADLPSAHTLQEYSFLQQIVREAGHTAAWIGGYFFQGYWKWDDGTLFDYNFWQSHTSSSSYSCLYLNSQSNRGWSNSVCTTALPFICSLKLNYCQ